MARSPVEELIALGRALEEGQAKLERLASIEQATREAEARLEKAREQEGAAGRAIADAAADADQKVAAYEASCRRSIEGLKARYDETVARGQEAIAAAEADAAGKLADLDEKIDVKARRVLELEDAEAALGQSIAGLRADLDALRKKLG